MKLYLIDKHRNESFLLKVIERTFFDLFGLLCFIFILFLYFYNEKTHTSFYLSLTAVLYLIFYKFSKTYVAFNSSFNLSGSDIYLEFRGKKERVNVVDFIFSEKEKHFYVSYIKFGFKRVLPIFRGVNEENVVIFFKALSKNNTINSIAVAKHIVNYNANNFKYEEIDSFFE